MRASPGLKRPRRSLLGLTAPLAALLGLAVASLLPSNPYFWDALNVAMPAQPDPRVLVVGIDDQTLGDYGRLSNWNRNLYARAIDTLQTAGAKVVGVDMLLDTPAPGDLELAQVLGGQSNVVMATSPQQPLSNRWSTATGISGLNVSGITGGKTGYFQTAYQGSDGKLWPTISTQVVQLAGDSVTLDTQPRLLRVPKQEIPVVSFGELLSGNVRFSQLQNKLVLLGVTANGVPGSQLLDSGLHPVPGVVMQARAVSSLLEQPYARLSHWLLLLLCAAVGVLTATLRGYWGFVLALLLVLLGMLAFALHLLLPSITLSLVAILSGGLVLAERHWLSRQVQRLDPLTGLGSRLAFTRAVELRWGTRHTRPLGLILLDVEHFHKVNDQYGRLAGNEVLKQVAQTLLSGRSRRELLFRWGSDEFALLIEGASESELQTLSRQLQGHLQGLHYRDLPLRVSLGHALSTGLENPTELIERASRDRFRMKYEGEEIKHQDKL